MVGEKGEEESRERERDTEAGGRYKLLFSHSTAIFSVPTRCQPQRAGGGHSNPGDRVPPFYKPTFYWEVNLQE